MTDHKAMQHKLVTLLTMASDVAPGDESTGIFWCHGPETEPPFTTMIDVPTLYRAIASHPDLVAALVELSQEKGK